MGMIGRPTDDLSPLFLETKELRNYNAFLELRGLLRDNMLSEVRQRLPEFEKILTSNQTFIRQFIIFTKIYIDGEMPHQEAIDKLYETLEMSVINFDKNNISKYRFTYNEIYIVFAIAMRLEKLGDLDNAASLYKALIESRGSAAATKEDMSALYPSIMFNLSNVLGKAKRYHEALEYCESARRLCVELKNSRLLPHILYNTAWIQRLMGEEKRIYRTYYNRAYHVAYAMDNKEIVDIIKKEAEEFGFSEF